MSMHRCRPSRMPIIQAWSTNESDWNKLWHSCSFDNRRQIICFRSISNTTSSLTIFIFITNNNRRKEQPPSEKGTTNPIRRAVVAGNRHTISRRRHALAVDILQRRCATSIGAKRPRGDELSERDGWGTWRLWPVGSRMHLGRELRLRKWFQARNK